MSKINYFWGLVFLINIAWADISINEIAWSGTPESSSNEWIELFNDGKEIIYFENWTLNSADGTPHITLSGSITAGGFYLLERTDDTSVPNIDADQIYTGALSNTSEELILSDNMGNEIDRTPSGGWIAGISTPERRSMALVGGVWETYAGEIQNEIYGTPGAVNSAGIINSGRSFISARPSMVEITELSPTKCGEDEWIEFEVWGNAKSIEMTNWMVKRGTSEKNFAELGDALALNSGGVLLAGVETGLADDGSVGKGEIDGTGNIFTEDELVYLGENAESPLRFTIMPSALSLPDDGGILEIVNEAGERLDMVNWDETKSGESGGVKWCEIWNRTGDGFWPMRSTAISPTHTRGEKNNDAPALPNELKMEIVEVAPNRTDKIDFVELIVREIPDATKLPLWSLRHNGTELFVGGGEELVKGDRLTLLLQSEKISESPDRWLNRTFFEEEGTAKVWESSTRNGLNGSNGTLELDIWNGTSWEQNEDFVCWAQVELSEMERNRLDKHIPSEWSGKCVNVDTLIANESMARYPLAHDTNLSSDFGRHFNGSPGVANFPVNNAPIAKIMSQGARRIYETSLNLTGYDKENPSLTSSDPDGNHDINNWKWEINGKSCGDYHTDGWEWSTTRKNTTPCEEESSKSNPGLIYFDFGKFDTFAARLTVTDFSGASDAVNITLDRDPFKVGGRGGNSFSSSIEKWMTKEFNKIEKDKPFAKADVSINEEETADFFNDFIAAVDWSQIANTPLPKESEVKPSPKKRNLYARDRTQHISKSRLRKNIGLVFLV